jgi:hypothetical protein
LPSVDVNGPFCLDLITFVRPRVPRSHSEVRTFPKLFRCTRNSCLASTRDSRICICTKHERCSLRTLIPSFVCKDDTRSRFRPRSQSATTGYETRTKLRGRGQIAVRGPYRPSCCVWQTSRRGPTCPGAWDSGKGIIWRRPHKREYTDRPGDHSGKGCTTGAAGGTNNFR